MRKSKKRLLSGVLAALMILTTVPVNALEAATQTSEDPYSSVYVEEQSSENSLGENLDESTSQEVATPSYISENTGYNGVYIESEETSQEQQESSTSTEAPLRAPVISIDAEDENNYWDLDVVFYDSTVGGGTQPLTSIDWAM